MDIIQVTLWVFLGLFVLTGLLTLASLFRIPGAAKPLVELDPGHQTRLVNALLLEVIASVIALGGIGIDRYRQGIERLEAATNRALQLDVSRLHEPSGLTRTNLVGAEGSAVALAVDDEQSGVFLIEVRRDRMLVHGAIRYDSWAQEGPDDTEGVCFDDGYYYVITSHRRFGKDQTDERRLLRFRIADHQWREDLYQIRVLPENVRDVGQALVTFLGEGGVTVAEDDWAVRRRGRRHPFALEVEGLACFGNRLVLGLKWPVHDGAALMAVYDWSTEQFVGKPVQVDFDGMGISSLAYVEELDIWLVAANPFRSRV